MKNNGFYTLIFRFGTDDKFNSTPFFKSLLAVAEEILAFTSPIFSEIEVISFKIDDVISYDEFIYDTII